LHSHHQYKDQPFIRLVLFRLPGSDGKNSALCRSLYQPCRDKRDQARKQVAAGIDPSEHRKAHRAANSFEVVALERFRKFVFTKGASLAE
jgi:hypothetical protein